MGDEERQGEGCGRLRRTGSESRKAASGVVEGAQRGPWTGRAQAVAVASGVPESRPGAHVETGSASRTDGAGLGEDEVEGEPQSGVTRPHGA